MSEPWLDLADTIERTVQAYTHAPPATASVRQGAPPGRALLRLHAAAVDAAAAVRLHELATSPDPVAERWRAAGRGLPDELLGTLGCFMEAGAASR